MPKIYEPTPHLTRSDICPNWRAQPVFEQVKKKFTGFSELCDAVQYKFIKTPYCKTIYYKCENIRVKGYNVCERHFAKNAGVYKSKENGIETSVFINYKNDTIVRKIRTTNASHTSVEKLVLRNYETSDKYIAYKIRSDQQVAEPVISMYVYNIARDVLRGKIPDKIIDNILEFCGERATKKVIIVNGWSNMIFDWHRATGNIKNEIITHVFPLYIYNFPIYTEMQKLGNTIIKVLHQFYNDDSGVLKSEAIEVIPKLISTMEKWVSKKE